MKRLLLFLIILLLPVPACATTILFSDALTFNGATNIIRSEDFEAEHVEGLFPATFDGFTYDGDGEIGHSVWRIGEADWLNIGSTSNVLYSAAVGVDYFFMDNPTTAFGFDFAAGQDPEVTGNVISFEITELNGQTSTFDYTVGNDSQNAWAYYGFVSDFGISEIRISNLDDGILDTNFVFDNVSIGEPSPETYTVNTTQNYLTDHLVLGDTINLRLLVGDGHGTNRSQPRRSVFQWN
jgi:hypothetical protein